MKDVGARVRAEKAAHMASALLVNSLMNVLSHVTNAEASLLPLGAGSVPGTGTACTPNDDRPDSKRN